MCVGRYVRLRVCVCVCVCVCVLNVCIRDRVCVRHYMCMRVHVLAFVCRLKGSIEVC